MFGDFQLADYIAHEVFLCDSKCRLALWNGIIVDEPDYVSTLSTSIRKEIKMPKICVHVQTLSGGEEQSNGADGIMVFQIGNEVKVGIFEGKWPRFKQNNYPWDKLQGRVSHFSDQIDRQHVWQNEIAVWEMFFNEEEYGKDSPPYEYFSSSCVWHDDAHSFMNSEGLVFNKWTTDKLKKLLGKRGTNIYSIVFDIVSCKKGKKHLVNANQNTVTIVSPANNNIVLEVPLPIDLDKEFDERIREFMERQKLSSYIYIVAENSSNKMKN